MQNKDFFPDIITNLPQADIPVEGLTSYLLQCTNHQVIFINFEKDVEIPEYSHEVQWGIVLDAKINAGYRDLTLSNQKDRYQI